MVRVMKRVEVPSYPVSIFMAGDWSAADLVCDDYCLDVGLCVTLTPTAYTYTGGYEDGFIVGLINYPRFPKEPSEIWSHAEALGERIREACGQQSYTIQAPDKTVWFSHRAEGTPNA